MAKAKRRRAGGKKQAAPSSEDAGRYLIQLDLGKRPAGIAEVQKLLRRPGVELDPSYGPILINAEIHRYVVRGWATPSARQQAEDTIPGVQFFGDPQISPTAPDG